MKKSQHKILFNVKKKLGRKTFIKLKLCTWDTIVEEIFSVAVQNDCRVGHHPTDGNESNHRRS